MLFAEEIASRKRGAEARSRENTLAFLDKYKIERSGVEAMLARLCPAPCDIYYVSTVPAGLAGSKSDLDFILVPQESDPFQDLSSMLFYGGRRVGAKIIPSAEIARVLSAMQGLKLIDLLRGAGGGTPSFQSFSSIKWTDAERLVNGISFTRGATYLSALDDIAVYAVARALANYRQHRFAAKLAARAGADAAAEGYLVSAVMWAMDAVMSGCGHVQANFKWTLERWSRFRTTNDDSVAADAKRLVSRAWREVSSSPRAVDAALAPLDLFFSRMLDAAGVWSPCGLRVSANAISSPYLPGAVCIKGGGRTAVLSAPLFDKLDTFDEEQGIVDLSPADAAALLLLLQLELIVIRDHGGAQ